MHQVEQDMKYLLNITIQFENCLLSLIFLNNYIKIGSWSEFRPPKNSGFGVGVENVFHFTASNKDA